jgi:CheY-like chemotaxis protein
MQILLVEDNPADVRLIREALRHTEASYSLSVVDDGEKAIDFLRDRAPGSFPDLVLLDLNLPRKSGAEVLVEIKGDRRLKRIPVVILTSSRSERDVNTAYDSGANSYLRKPADLDHLYSLANVFAQYWLNWVILPTQTGEGLW